LHDADLFLESWIIRIQDFILVFGPFPPDRDVFFLLIITILLSFTVCFILITESNVFNLTARAFSEG